MAYKKYIQRNGKLYGPYLYESKRVDGKVVSEYHGSEEPKKSKGVKVRDYKKIFFIFAGVFLLGVLVYFLATFPTYNKFTGGAILNVDTSYTAGKPLNGVLKFSLKEGELIPASSKIVFENSGKSYEFPLSEVIQKSPSNGEYYIDGKSIQGSGAGYGLEGKKTVYPDVKFVLQVYKQATEEQNTSTNETSQEITADQVTTNETNQETSTEGSTAPITGNAVRSGGFLTSLFGMTGMVSMELQSEIDGVTSKDKSFVYELKEGEEAELKPKSVSVGGKEVADNIVSLNVKNNEVSVTTDYSEVENGYGKDYLGDKENTLSLDLSDLNLSVEEGDLNITLIYGNEQILQLTTTLKEGEKTSGQVVEQQTTNNQTAQNNETNKNQVEKVVEVPSELNISEEIANQKNETVEQIVNSSIWDMGDFLTADERKILTDKFGDTPIKTVKSELFNGRIIIGYDFGGYSAEYSYDASLTKDVLEVQMARDRIKFLKDIANAVSKKENSPETLTGFNETYLP